jgi:hypothetical protein
MRTTYTYAILDVSQAAFEEIKAKLEAAGYQHAFGEDDGRTVIDMHGIAVAPEDSTDTGEMVTVTTSAPPRSLLRIPPEFENHLRVCPECARRPSYVPLCSVGAAILKDDIARQFAALLGECVHGELIEGSCNACSDEAARGGRPNPRQVPR